MNNRSASYTVAKFDRTVFLQDIGVHSVQKTITNDIDFVVSELWRKGILENDLLLRYIDSDSEYSSVEHKDGKFIRFL